MTGQELDLAAAIGAAETAMYTDACPHDGTDGCDCPDLEREASLAVEAALPHVREVLAGLIEDEASGPDTSFATDQVLFMAARIVRGEP